MVASPWESSLLLKENNTTKCLNKSEHVEILEARAENPMQMLIEDSNSMLGLVLDRPEVESEKLASNMTRGSDSTSTSDYALDQVHSIQKLSNSVLDSLPDRLSKQLKQVSTLVLTKDDVEAVDSNCSSRKGLMLI